MIEPELVFKIAFAVLAFYATLMLAFSGILPAPPEPEREIRGMP